MNNIPVMVEIERDCKQFFGSLTEVQKILDGFNTKDYTEDYIAQRIDSWNRSYQKLIRALTRRKKEIVQNQEAKMAK